MKLTAPTTILLGLLSGTTGANSITRKFRVTYIESNIAMKGELPEDREIFAGIGDMEGSVPCSGKDCPCEGKDCDDDVDDDDNNYRTTIDVPPCEVDGKNYRRCDPSTRADNDADTCDKIEKEVCGKEFDKEYCECIGLGVRVMPQLRPTVSSA